MALNIARKTKVINNENNELLREFDDEVSFTIKALTPVELLNLYSTNSDIIGKISDEKVNQQERLLCMHNLAVDVCKKGIVGFSGVCDSEKELPFSEANLNAVLEILPFQIAQAIQTEIQEFSSNDTKKKSSTTSQESNSEPTLSGKVHTKKPVTTAE